MPPDYCPYCGKTASKELRCESFDVVCKGGVLFAISYTPYLICNHCGFQGYGADGEAARTAAHAKVIQQYRSQNDNQPVDHR